MADFYLDHLAYPAYAATPSGSGWPLPAQDGDGQAPGLAVSAVAVVDCTGVTATAGHSLGIAGATITCVATGATTNQFNAATGSALATNIVGAINAATSLIASGASVTLPQLRDFVFARVSPGDANVVQIMTRAGGAIFNHAAYPAMVINTAGGFAPGITQFSGGVSGAWGYLWNDTTLWPSSKAADSYGAGRVNNTTGGLLGAQRRLTLSDVVWLRAKDQELVYSVATRTVNSPWLMMVDANNEKWPDTLGKKFTVGRMGDTAGGVFNFLCRPDVTSQPCQFYLSSNVRGALVLTSRSQQGNTASTSHLFVGGGPCTGGFVTVENAFLDDRPIAVYQLGIGFLDNNSAGAKSVTIRRCDYRCTRASGTHPLVLGLGSGSLAAVVEDVDFVFDLITDHSGLCSHAGISFNQNTSYVVRNCKAQSPNGVIRPFATALVASNLRVSMRAENLQGFSAVPIGLFGGAGGGGDAQQAISQNVGPKQGTRLETSAAMIDWTADQSYPTYRAVLADGTPWSWRAVWNNSATVFTGGGLPVDQVQLTKISPPSAATRTITAEILVDSTVPNVSTKDIALSISYTDSGGIQRHQTTMGAAAILRAPVPLSVSTAAWVMNGYGSHLKRSLSITTLFPVAASSVVAATVQFCSPAPGSTFVFVDPEIEVA